GAQPDPGQRRPRRLDGPRPGLGRPAPDLPPAERLLPPVERSRDRPRPRHLPAVTAPDRAVRAFLDHLSVERGMSPHTVAAYRRDLNRYLEHLHAEGVDDVGQVTGEHVAGFPVRLATGADDPAPLAASRAARAVVAVRRLHRFLLAEGDTTTDPSAAVQPPSQAKRLPKAISVEQVQAILDVPDTETVAGLRDACLLE